MNQDRETIDSDEITLSNADINYRNGYSFTPGLRITMSVLALFSVLAIVSGGNGYIIGPPLLLLALYIVTSTYGTQISLKNKYIKPYTSSFGIKKGKWISTILMPDITVLKMGKSVVLKHTFGAADLHLDNEIFEVYLLSKNHRKKILLFETKSYNEAYLVANELAEKMNKNLNKFNPVISAATRSKRYNRH